MWYGVVRGGTGWYGVIRGCTEWYVVLRGGREWYGVVRCGIIYPTLDIRSILLVNGGT